MVTRAALILLCLGLAAGAQSKPKTPARNCPQDRHQDGQQSRAHQGFPHSHHPYFCRRFEVHAFPGQGA